MGPPSLAGSIDGAEARVRLAATVTPLMEGAASGSPVVVTGRSLRNALVDPDRLTRPPEPFRWKPAFVRRSLGLAVVEACASGRFRAPADAVGAIAEGAVAEWERTGWRTYHWEPWLAGLASGARAVVLAETVGWSTSLWSSLDWPRLVPDVQVGGPYDQWVCPGARAVRLKARPDLRVPLVTGRGGAKAADEPPPALPMALVTVEGGAPAPGWADELAFLALVAGLRSPTRPLPPRVMGLWPDAGVHRCVDIGTVAVDRVLERVAATVAAVVTARQAAVG
jgi:hypothetical protein